MIRSWIAGASGLLLLPSLALITTVPAHAAGTKPSRTVAFTNTIMRGESTTKADDLHVMMRPSHCRIKKKPTNSSYTPQGGSLHFFYDLSVTTGQTVHVEFECDTTPIKILAWWWTTGGTYERHGQILRSKNDRGRYGDPHDKRSVHAAGGPAAGNGIVRVGAGGVTGHFSPTPGSPPSQVAAELLAFATSLDAGNGPVVYGALEADDLVYLDRAVYGGAPEEALTVELLVPDDGVDLHILTPAPERLFNFTLEGGCPGPVTGEAFGALPGSVVEVYAGTPGSEMITTGPCAGVALDLMPTAAIGTLTTDAEGDAALWLDESWCDSDVLVQAVELSTCEVSSLTGL